MVRLQGGKVVREEGNIHKPGCRCGLIPTASLKNRGHLVGVGSLSVRRGDVITFQCTTKPTKIHKKCFQPRLYF